MTTQAFSPAKINLYLRIAGKRADGYHELETVMLPLDFGDTMTFQPRDTGIELTCDHPSLPVDETNLVGRAARRLAEIGNIHRGAKIALQKRTPLAAGLGGGSSNAATALIALNELWKLNAPISKLHDIASQLGSDVNFFLAGSAALCRGRGERVEPVACKFTGIILLVNPGFGISTRWAYERWSAAAAGTLTAKPPEVSLLLRALAEDDLAAISRCLFNSLEAPSVKKFPVLELIKQLMHESGAAGALMSGSGATVFGLFADATAAQRAAANIREQFGPDIWTQIAKTAVPEQVRSAR